MPSEARQKKIMEKLNRAQKCSILGPQNLGSGGGPGPRGPPPPGSAPEGIVNCRSMVITSKVLISCNAKEVKYSFKDYGDILILHVKRVNESISCASDL